MVLENVAGNQVPEQLELLAAWAHMAAVLHEKHSSLFGALLVPGHAPSDLSDGDFVVTFISLSWLTSHTFLLFWKVQVRASEQGNISCQRVGTEPLVSLRVRKVGPESTVLSASGYAKAHASVVQQGSAGCLPKRGSQTFLSLPLTLLWLTVEPFQLQVKKPAHWAGEVFQWEKEPLQSLVG